MAESTLPDTAAQRTPITMGDLPGLADAFWMSDDGDAVKQGGRLDRYLPHFLFAGHEPLFEFTSDEDARAFYEDGRYESVRRAMMNAWPVPA